MPRQREVVGQQERQRHHAAEREKPGCPGQLLPPGGQNSEERGQQEKHRRLRSDYDPEGPEETRKHERARGGALATLREEREAPGEHAESRHVSHEARSHEQRERRYGKKERSQQSRRLVRSEERRVGKECRSRW